MDYNDLIWETGISGMFLAGGDAQILRCNAAFASVFGFETCTEMRQNGLAACFDGEEEYNRFREQLYSKQSISGYFVSTKNKQGQKILYQLNARLFKDDDGTDKIFGSVLDQTELKKSEKSLLESQRVYRDLFENSMEIIQSFDQNGKLHFCNRTWHEKLEYSQEDLENITLFDIIADEYKPHCQIMFQEVMQGKRITEVQVEFISKSGKRIWVEGNVVPLVQNGKLVATHGFFRDITEKVKAIQSARAHEQLISAIFDSLPICLYVKNHHGQYLLSNNYMNATLGKQVNGLHDREVFSEEIEKVLNATDREAIQKPKEVISFNLTMNNNGDSRYFYCGKKAIVLASGEERLFGFAIDITNMVKSTQKMEANEQMLQFVMNHANEGLILYEKENMNGYKLSFFNQRAGEFFTDHKVFESIETIFPFLGLSADKPVLFENNEPMSWERNIGTEAKTRNVQIRLNHLSSAANNDSILLSFYDNTSNKALLEDVEKKYQENLLLIGEVYHRVKNNLAIIDGIFELKKIQITEPTARQLITDMQLRVKSIALVHQKLYDASDLTSVPFAEYVEEMSAYYKRLYMAEAKRGVSFDFKIEKNIYLDITRAISLGLLMSELISNSLKYALVDGRVKISLELKPDGDTLVFSYRDSGPGIPPEKLHAKGEGFGLKLINSLQRQLKGNGEFPASDHFAYLLHFPSK
ncbi:MAG: PAS domain S-box protein [Bacteroidota bacterium]|jgi:PAS domain S-box-containing protein